MKKKKHILSLLLALALSVNAFAMEIPTDTVVQNLNGSQQLIKTYTLPPDADPQKLIAEPFELDGFLYTFADIVKTENRVEDHKYHVEQVTVETETNSLPEVQKQFAPTLEYDDGLYSGTLTFDSTAILTEPSGYTSQSRTITDTKTIGPLDRNDMSYVPSTSVKDGVTLKLSNVDWQIIGTDVAGDSLAPTTYQAVATYTGTGYRKVATGYTSIGEYFGEISYSRVESITYKVTYLGKEVTEVDAATGITSVDNPAAASHGSTAKNTVAAAAAITPYLTGGLCVLAIVTLTVLLVRSRREVRMLQEPEDEADDNETEEEEK